MNKKTIKLLSILTMFVFAISSCAKDRTCECTVNGSVIEDTEYEHVTKRWMKNTAHCVSYTSTSSGTSVKVECEIK